VTDRLDLSGANPWTTLSSRIVFDDGRVRLRQDQVIQPDGARGEYTYLEAHGPVVAIVPVDHELNVFLVRQWRYPWRRNSWEIPAGHGEQDESPIDGARRELAEEVGLSAGRWEPLGEGFASAAFAARYYLFLARDLQPADAGRFQREGAERDMITRRLPLADAAQTALDGQIEHAMTVVGLVRAAHRLGMGGATFDPCSVQC
jgi:8-oxo-dGTP pyrophosphatase MutT (NUDIX family)